MAGDGGELFAAAIDARTRHKVALRLVDGHYQRVFESTKALRAWRGPDGSVWVLEGTRAWRLSGGRQEAVARQGPLSGLVYDVVTEPGGVFWIASTTGVGRYAPPLWRTPDAIKGLDQPVHAAVEDARTAGSGSRRRNRCSSSTARPGACIRSRWTSRPYPTKRRPWPRCPTGGW